MGPKKRPSGGVVPPNANERRQATASTSSSSSSVSQSPSSVAASKAARGAPAKNAVSSGSSKVSNVGGGGAGGNNSSGSSSGGSSTNNKANQSRAQAAAELAAASNSSASSDSSGSKSKSSDSGSGASMKSGTDKKDDKAKAINKMLKNLDIKISGFDNILPKEDRGETLLKSSISENVKTKSRAAAVKVIANLNPHKANASGSSRRLLQREEPPRKVNRVEEKVSAHKEKEEKRRKDEEKEEKRRKDDDKEERRKKDTEKEERKRKDDEKEEVKRKDDEKEERKRKEDGQEEKKRKDDEKEVDKRTNEEEKEDKIRKEEENVEKKVKEEEKKAKDEEKKTKEDDKEDKRRKEEDKKAKECEKEDKKRKEEDKKAKEHEKEEKKRKEEEKDEKRKKLDDRESNAPKTKGPVAPSKDPKDTGAKCTATRKTVSPEDSNANSNKRKYPKTISKESSSSSSSPPSESKKDTNAQSSSIDTKITEQESDSVSGKKKYSNLPKSKQNKKNTAPREDSQSVGDDSKPKKAHSEAPESKKVKEAEKSSKDKKEVTASKASGPTKHSKADNDKKEKDISPSASLPEERTPPKSPPPQKPPENTKSDAGEPSKVLPDSNTEPVQMDIEETPVKVAKTPDIQPTTKEPLKKDTVENSQKEKDSSKKEPLGGQKDTIGKNQKETPKKDTATSSQQEPLKKDTHGGSQKELSKKEAPGKSQKDAEKKDQPGKKVEEKSSKKAEEKTDEKKGKVESEHDPKAASEKNCGRSSGSGIYKSLGQAAKGDKAKPKDGKSNATPTESSKNDIYDFKSGSEEELNIKMELPTLKNILEFSEDDKKDDAKKKAEEAKSSGSAKSAAATKGSETKAAVKTPTKTLPSCSAAMKKSNVSAAYTKGAPVASAVKNITAYNKNKKSHSPVAAPKQQSKPTAPAKPAAKKSAAEKKKIQEEESCSSAESSDSEDAKKLITFGPKRHRMASLNALAKVQCLYENESRTAYELGLSKATQLPPKMRTLDGSDDEKEVKEPKSKAAVEEKPLEVVSAIKKEDKKAVEAAVKEEDEQPTTAAPSAKAKAKPEVAAVEPPAEELETENKRELRVVPGGRGFGKHWEFYSDSEENEEIERLKLKKKKMQKKWQTKKEKEAAEKPKEKEKSKKKEAEKPAPEKPKEKEKEKKAEKPAVEKPPEKLKRKYNKAKKPLKKLAKPSKAVSSNDELSSDDLSGQEGNSEKDDKTYNLPKSHPDAKKPPKKRKHVVLRDKREVLIGDYKGILARKRMASLNATAIVAATYEVERHLDKNLAYDYTSYSDSSDEEEESRPASPAPKQVKSSKKAEKEAKKDAADEEAKEKGTKLKHNIKSEPSAKSETTSTSKASVSNVNEESCDSKYSKDTKESTNTDTNTATTAAIRDCSAASLSLGNLVVGGSGKDGLIRPKSSSVVIVQDTDVTITGVYVNAKSGSSQEAYCKMQYRVQSSVTEERLLRPGSVEPPPKSYTPLSALSSMLPPCASGAPGAPGLLSDVHCASSPGPPSMVTSLTDAINANSIYHSNDLGLHTEHGAPEHGAAPPPPPAYVAAYHTAAANAAAAAAAAAGIHGHHHPLPKQYGLHQYPFQPGQPPGPGERTLHAPMPSTHPHHYPGMSPGGAPHCESSPQGRCDVGSPPPSAYRPNSAYMGGPLMPLPPPPTSMTVGSSSSAFCAPQSQHVQHQQQQQQNQNPGSQHQEQHDGNGYYQPAGPLISSHLLPQPPNVPLLPSVGGAKAKHPAAIPLPLGSDPDQQPPHHLAAHHVPQQAPGAADSTPPDSHVLITGSDLTPFRYQASQGQAPSGSSVPPPHPSPHHPHQQPHPLHHQTTAYPRSMHPQMHYSPAAYPPANYYIPYPGEPMCYSAPTAYQPYFSTKVYPNTGPPPPHHPAYRRYPYYPAGPPHPASQPPPASHSSPPEHYGEHPAAPPSQAAATSATPPQAPPAGGTPSPTTQQSAGGGSASQASPSAGPGTQLVPAGHHHGSAGPPPPPPHHLEHYPGQGYYAPYPAGGASPAGQCYPRSIQPPYMDYPQCPCPMQQSCPKNVHTGPHIGNNRNNNNNNSSSSNNASSNNNVIISRNSCSNAATMTSAAATTTTVAASANSCNTSNNTNIMTNNNNTNTTSNNYSSSPAGESSQANEDSAVATAATASLNPPKLASSGGVVVGGAVFAANESTGAMCKNMISLNTNRGPVTNNNTNNTNNKTNVDKAANLLQKVKCELKVELPDTGRAGAKSQYEENVQPPPTPPESYGTLEDDEKEERYAAAMAQLGGQPKTLPMPPAKEASLSTAPAVRHLEAYDLTNGQEPAPLGGPNGLCGPGSMPPAAKVVGRKARIGKTMAREMMYAGVANAAAVATATSMASPLYLSGQSGPARAAPQNGTAESQFDSSQKKMGPNKAGQQLPPAPGPGAEAMELLLLKAKIKTEKIKQEDDFPMVLASPACARSELVGVPELKAIIKTEPSEVAAEASPLKVAAKCVSTVVAQLMDENDVLDLCRSPLPGAEATDGASASKRLNILEGSKGGGCKKSPSSSYKSLIKQAEPRAYLCLSRKRTQRYRKSHWRTSVGGAMRRRHINLTEQQKKRLRMRNRKLFDVEKRRQEMIEKRRTEGRLKAMKDADSPAAASDSTTTTTASSVSSSMLTKDCSSKESPQDLLASCSAPGTAEDFIPLALNSPLRCRKALMAPLNGLKASDDVLGYYSDPETRCSGGVKSLFRAKDETTARCMPASLASAATGGERKHGCASGYEKRSKSETKKPIRGSAMDGSRLGSSVKTAKISKEQKVMPPKDASTSKAIEPLEESIATPKAKGKVTHKDGGNKQNSAAKKAKLSGERKDLLLEEEPGKNVDRPTSPETNNNEYEKKSEASSVEATDPPASKQTPSCEAKEAEEDANPQAQPQPLQEQTPPAQQFQPQHSDNTVFLAQTAPMLPRIGCHAHNHYQTGSKRSKRTKFGRRKKPRHSTVSFELDDTLPPARGDVIPKWNNGWMWEGEPFQGAVFLNSDDHLVIRTCYPAMRHSEGDIIRARDCVLLKANEDNELPYVAKVAHLWENPEDGEMMMSLLWYYRPEHTEQGRQLSECPDEVYASRHRDHNSVACIEDKCYVLTFNEYCRYRRRLRAAEEDIEDWNIVPKRANCYPNSRSLPPINTNPELVMFCRRAYEFRTKRLMKMPSKQDYYVVTA